MNLSSGMQSETAGGMRGRLLASVLAASAACLWTLPAVATEFTSAPDGATAWIVSPQDGDTVPTRFKVVFGLTDFGIAPAGVEVANTGHHHLLIDTELADYSQPIPADAQHRHFGKGQTEVELELLPGQHTLQLVLGDYLHRPHNPPVQSQRITINVSEQMDGQ